MRSITRTGRKDPVRIAIIGCGVSGISLTIKLLKLFEKNGYVQGRDWTLRIYDREDGPGGTWRINSYPGCACDVPVHYYSLSTHPKSDWKSAYAGQEEIQKYWDEIYDSNQISRFVNFNTTFKSSTWDPSTQSHTLELESFEDNFHRVFRDQVDLLVSCIGGLSCVSEPELGEFKGLHFHSTKWPKFYGEGISDPKIDWLKGKKVGIIGGGSTACQIVPSIINVEGIRVHQFVRTPNWIVPRVQLGNIRIPLWKMSRGLIPLPVSPPKEHWIVSLIIRYDETQSPSYSKVTQLLFRWIPGFRFIYRFLIYLLGNELTWLSFRQKNSLANSRSKKNFTQYMKSALPERYWKDFIPDFEPGCKRTIVDPMKIGYTSALWKPNMQAYRIDSIKVVEDGVILKDGKKIDLDVLVYATGFSVAQDGLTMNIGGREENLPSYWNGIGGPEAFMGILVPKFPNFVSTVGPNSITGHQSVIAFVECQIDYISRLVLGMMKGKVGSFEIKEKVFRDFNEMLKPRLERSAMNGSCSSWYKTKGQKKITTAWPGTLAEFWWRTSKVDWNQLEVVPPL